jgi:heat shock protein HslJ
MKIKRFVWLTPILTATLVIAYLYPISGNEQPQEIPNDDINGNKWILNSLKSNGNQVQITGGKNITIKFNDQQVKGSSGCNTYSANYSFNHVYSWLGTYDPNLGQVLGGTGGNVTLGPISRTEMACMYDNIMELEDQFLSALSQVTNFEVSAGVLKLIDESEQTVLLFLAE